MQNVYYFTRTGSSRRIAGKLARGLGADQYEIIDGNRYDGIFGYLRAGYYASRRRTVAITVSREPVAGEKLYVVGPVWAGGPAPALRSFRKAYPGHTMVLILNDLGQPLEKLKHIGSEGFERVYLINHRDKQEDRDIEAILLEESI